MQTTTNAKPPKVYVAVKADFREDGVMLPREITWEEMATHSSILAWRIPGTAEPGGLPSMGSHRVRHD